MRLVYLAGPIDIDPDGGRNWREKAIEILAARGVASYNPARAFNWTGGMEGAEKVVRINRVALEQCDSMVLHLNGHPTVGSFRELQMAADLGKPTVIWAPTDVYPNTVYLHGIFRHSDLETVVDTLLNWDPRDLKIPV